jgi:predicted metal-dependent phosphoesterase TrpH
LDFNQNKGVDLHIHSTASDGTYGPIELLGMAAQAGLHAIAITDHDSLEGSRQVFSTEIPDNLQLVSGVEISVQPPASWSHIGGLHILGYGIDLDHAGLAHALEELLRARERRIPQILAKLRQNGIDLPDDQVEAESGNGAPGRPHVAKVMVRHGIVKDIDEAFDRFLAKGKPGYVDKYRLDCRQAFDLIRSAGGLPVLAHPYLIADCRQGRLAEFLKTFCAMGLAGVEAYYPKHPPEFTREVIALAQQLDLVVTGGSDFHGDLTPGIELGRGYGNLPIPAAVYQNLMEKIVKRLT